MEHRYLTVPEVADLLRVPRSTVYYWRTIDYGPAAVKVGKRVLYDRKVVEEWYREQMGADAP